MNVKDAKKIMKYIDMNYKLDENTPSIGLGYFKIIFLVLRGYDTTAKIASYLRKPWQTVAALIRNRYSSKVLERDKKKIIIRDAYKNMLTSFIKNSFKNIIAEVIPYKYYGVETEKEKKLQLLRSSRLTLDDVVVILQNTKDEILRDMLKYTVKNEEIIEYYNMQLIKDKAISIKSNWESAQRTLGSYRKELNIFKKDKDVQELMQGGELETIEIKQDTS